MLPDDLAYATCSCRPNYPGPGARNACQSRQWRCGPAPAGRGAAEHAAVQEGRGPAPGRHFRFGRLLSARPRVLPERFAELGDQPVRVFRCAGHRHLSGRRIGGSQGEHMPGAERSRDTGFGAHCAEVAEPRTSAAARSPRLPSWRLMSRQPRSWPWRSLSPPRRCGCSSRAAGPRCCAIPGCSPPLAETCHPAAANAARHNRASLRKGESAGPRASTTAKAV
jgi:hypothetical protein